MSLLLSSWASSGTLVCACTCQGMHVEVREQLTVFSFHHVDLENWTCVIRPGGRHLYSLSHLAIYSSFIAFTTVWNGCRFEGSLSWHLYSKLDRNIHDTVVVFFVLYLMQNRYPKWIYGWRDRRMGRWMNGWMDEWRNGWVGVECMERWISRWMGRRWVHDGWMDGWMVDKWMSVYMDDGWIS